MTAGPRLKSCAGPLLPTRSAAAQWQAGKRTGGKTLLLGLLSGRSPHDFTYLTLAAHLGCPLVTADRRFVAALEEIGLSGMAVLPEDFDPGEARRISAE